MTKYCLIIKENRQIFYFQYSSNHTFWTGDILTIGGYKVIVIKKKHDGYYVELETSLVNEGVTVIGNENLI